VKKNINSARSSTVQSSVSFEELVGLRNTRICSIERDRDSWVITVEQPRTQGGCLACSNFAVVKERPLMRLVDLPAFGHPVVILWRKYRMECLNDICSIQTWTIHDPRICSTRTSLTARCARWVTREVGKGRSVSELAKELNCHWSVVEDAMAIYGKALLEADKKRVGNVSAIGLDETLFVRRGSKGIKQYCTTIADVQNGKVIDVVMTNNFIDIAAWFDEQSQSWKNNIKFGTLDMSRTYRAIFRELLSHIKRVCDPYHVIQLFNRVLDEIRRRVQNEQLGRRGRKKDPLYRIRKLLLLAQEKLDPGAKDKLDAQLGLGDPNGEVGLGYIVKEAMRDFYQIEDPKEAIELFDRITTHCSKKSMSPELQRLSRTLKDWREEITNFHMARVTNGPTEALNNLIKRVKRTGFGFRNFENYRIRILLYAGKPNWRILNSIVVP
jgi:transposase